MEDGDSSLANVKIEFTGKWVHNSIAIGYENTMFLNNSWILSSHGNTAVSGVLIGPSICGMEICNNTFV